MHGKEVTMIQRPIVLALLLCDQVVVAEGTHNLTLVNCFRRLRVNSFPSVPRPLTAFAALIDGLGEMTITLVVSRLDTLEHVRTLSHQVQLTDPLREVWLLFDLQDCSFPVSGSY